MEVPEDEARRAALAAIVASGRATRRRPSRAAWIAASIVGAVCVLGFVLLLALDGAGEQAAGVLGTPGRGAGSPGGRGAGNPGGCGAGCGAGFGAGLGAGIALGYVLGARRRAQEPDHSSRRSP